MTWAEDRQPSKFWPLHWLPWEQGLESARISTFGYNAHFSEAGNGSIANISDFAKSLLYDMRHGSQPKGAPAIGHVSHGLLVQKQMNDSE